MDDDDIDFSEPDEPPPLTGPSEEPFVVECVGTLNDLHGTLRLLTRATRSKWLVPEETLQKIAEKLADLATDGGQDPRIVITAATALGGLIRDQRAKELNAFRMAQGIVEQVERLQDRRDAKPPEAIQGIGTGDKSPDPSAVAVACIEAEAAALAESADGKESPTSP